jgi:predicted outer membrane repeat protein
MPPSRLIKFYLSFTRKLIMRLHTLGFITVFCLGLLLVWQGRTAVSSTQAAPTVNVITTTATDDSFFPDGLCSLREAVHNANNNSQAFGLAGECPAGSATETDVIVLASLNTYDLTLTGNGNDEGDLDIFSNGLPLDLRIETDGDNLATIKMMVSGQRVIEVHNNATVEIDNVTILNGNGVAAGGGIYHSGASLALSGGAVAQNSAESGGGIYNNGGLLHLDGCVVAQNMANAGGGIYNHNGAVVVNECTVASNTGALGGGGIFNAGPQAHLTVTGSNLLTNFTSQQGGGIGNSEGVVLINGQSTIAGNGAALGGGGASNQDGALTVVDSAISANDGGEIGGGLYNWGMSGPTAVMTITNSAISQNATPNGSGAGIANHNGQLHVRDTTINGNIGDVPGDGTGYGGGVFAFAQHYTTTTTIHAATLFNNQHDYGGGIAVLDEAWGDGARAFTRITATEIRNNSADTGAGIYTRGWYTLIAENSAIALNSATHRGGGIAVRGEVAGQQTILDNIIVRANSAGGGGGIDLIGGAGLTIRNHTQITLNQAATGGGISNLLSRLFISNSTVQGNAASGVGGGVYTSNDAATEVRDSLVSDNIANAGGGFYTTDNSHLTVRNSHLLGNRATDGHGGGIFQTFAALHLLVKESYLAENSATDSGGGIYSEGSAEIRQSLIANNTAGFNGGGYYATTPGSDCAATPLSLVVNSTFSGNEAFSSGGGVAVYSGLTELRHVTIAHNSAPPLWPGGLDARNNATTCVRLGHTIVAHNAGSADVGANNTDQRLVSLGHNVIGTAGNNVDFNLELNLPSDQTNVADAGLAPLADNGGPTKTHALLEGSPAIGVGDPAMCAAAPANGLDQRGFTRGTAACDSGAYEVGGALLVYLPFVMR